MSHRVEFVGGPKDGEFIVVHEGRRIVIAGSPSFTWEPPPIAVGPDLNIIGAYERTERRSGFNEIWEWVPTPPKHVTGQGG